MPLQAVQRQTSSTEFVEWNKFLDDHEPNMPTADRFYWANIAAQITRCLVSESGQRIETKDFMLKFVPAPRPEVPQTWQEQREILMAVFGFKKGKK